MVTRHQDDRGVVAHLNERFDPEVSLFDGLLVGRQVTVDHKEVNARPDGICNKPFQAVRGVGEVVVFIEVEITGVSESYGHAGPPFMSEHQCILLLMGNGEAEEDRQLKG
jgi:hypothetical protein